MTPTCTGSLLYYSSHDVSFVCFSRTATASRWHETSPRGTLPPSTVTLTERPAQLIGGQSWDEQERQLGAGRALNAVELDR